MSASSLWWRLRQLPPRQLAVVAHRHLARALRAARSRLQDRWCSSYGATSPGELAVVLQRALPPLPNPPVATIHAAVEHRFDLLGSGPVRSTAAAALPLTGVSFFQVGGNPLKRVAPQTPFLNFLTTCSIRIKVFGRGSGGTPFSEKGFPQPPEASRAQAWKNIPLSAALPWVNPANRAESHRLAAMLPATYQPLDWHTDPVGGQRWNPATHSSRLGGSTGGSDIKRPWELSRGRHLPLLAIAGAQLQPALQAEFQHQVLDFMAANPPRHGVNWVCPMDVGIRVCNWLLSWNLFHCRGASFAGEFATVFSRGVAEHAEHIATHLEWSERFTNNHYLANIVGLLFACAHLPCSPRTDARLAFAVQELIVEVGKQFGADGGNFEASTSYHRLSTELVLFATALVLGLPPLKKQALATYDHRLVPRLRRRVAAPTAQTPLAAAPFPDWYVQRLQAMVEFTAGILRPDGRVPQFGDNDSGRLFTLSPVRLPDGSEDFLDHQHLLAAGAGLFPQARWPVAAAHVGEARTIRSLAANTALPAAARAPTDNNFRAFPDFGLFIYRRPRLYLALRCGSVGQNGIGGHAHNDQLSFELCVDGQAVIVDPGTHVYTADPTSRNRFRGTAMHNVLQPGDQEQNSLAAGGAGLFRLLDHRGEGHLLHADANEFRGEHCGFGAATRRQVRIGSTDLLFTDEYAGNNPVVLRLHLDPALTRQHVHVQADRATLQLGTSTLIIQMDNGQMQLRDSNYSPAYGVSLANLCLELVPRELPLQWRIQIGTAE